MDENEKTEMALLAERSRRLLEKNEPELLTLIQGMAGMEPGEVERRVRSWTGRRDTGRMAFWLALSLIGGEGV